MTRNVDALILTAMNTCWREPITLPILLGLLREQQPPANGLGPCGNSLPMSRSTPSAGLQNTTSCLQP